MLRDIDVLIIGAGLAGSTAARILAEKDKKVLVVDKRTHIGGNCFDERTPEGIVIHTYGPHLFHTDNFDAWNFMQRFAAMDVYEHRVKADIDGKLVPLPFSIQTISEVFPQAFAMQLELALQAFFDYGDNVSILDLRQTKDPLLEFLADYIYEKVYVNYTKKQWGLLPGQLNKEVTARVPVRVNRDTRYFTDAYQGVPMLGYTNLFNSMLDHKNIRVLLNTHSNEVLTIKNKKTYFLDNEFKGTVIYTGGLEELFDYKHGDLPYRSVYMQFEHLPVDSYQEVATVNYPNNYDFTRITEFKKIHKYEGQKGYTAILKEYPESYVKGENEPYYPILNLNTEKIYKKYAAMAKAVKNLIVLGRLAEYKYYDMDDTIINAMEKVKNL